MSQSGISTRRRSRLPLSVRISFILVLATVLPLGITVLISEGFARPALIDQSREAMLTDARTRTQLIDTYLNERLLDAGTLSQVPSVQSWLAEPLQQRLADVEGQQHAAFSLAAGQYRDKRYSVWSLFDNTGTLNLFYPLNIDKQKEAVVPPEFLDAMKNSTNGSPIISPVYFDPTTQKAYVHIYAPIYAGATLTTPFIGFMRARLNLDYITKIVSDDQGGQGSNQTAFILDEHGILIADSDRNAQLFSAVGDLAPDTQNKITSENWYGPDSTVPVKANPTLASIIRTNYQPASEAQYTSCTDASCFNLNLNGKNEEYQAARVTTALHWNYFVSRPGSSVTAVADSQLLYTAGAALICLILALLIGWWIARRITTPIMRSVEQLRESSESLNALSKKQQSASSEQLWVVDAIQVGLQSVQYYTDATRIAAHKLGEMGMELQNHWHRQNLDTIKNSLHQVISAAHYIERATDYQGDSSQKLSTAVKVTTQVNEQLADGAISATDAATQLGQVVNDLRHVVGQ